MPSTVPGANIKSDEYWRGWMSDVGRQVRMVREFVGLSQDVLAEAAGVSQGAVSRLEHGRGLATPLLMFLRIHFVLAEALRSLDPGLLNDPARRMLDATRDISPPVGPFGSTFSPITRDPALDRLMRRYSRLPEARRRAFAATLDAVSEAFAEESPPEGSGDRN